MEGETETEQSEMNGYLVEVADDSGHMSTVGVDAESGTEALRRVAGFSAWEIGVEPGMDGEDFTHIMVWSATQEAAEEAALEHAPDYSRVIEGSQARIGSVTELKIQEVL